MRGEHQKSDPQEAIGAAPVKMRLGTVTNKTPLQTEVAGVAMPASALRLNAQLAAALNVGDRVLLLTEDDQLFFIIMKVVAAA